VSHVDISILVLINLFRPVSSCPYRRDGIFVDTDLQQSEELVPREWDHNRGGSLQRVCTATDRRLFWFYLLWRLTTTFSLSTLLLWQLLNCFRHCFQGWYLANLWLFWFVRQVRFASQTLSIPQHWLHIGYWKQLVLWKGKGLACETKPTVHKHKQKQMQPFSNKLEW